MPLHKTLLDALGPRGWQLAHRLRLLGWRLRRPVNLAVGGIIGNEHGEVLLVRHSYQPHWMLPGGAVDWGETAAAALQRELLEECRLEIAQPELLEVCLVRAHGACNHVLVFRASAEGPAQPDGAEVLAAGWFLPGNLPADVQERSRELIRIHGVSAAPRP